MSGKKEKDETVKKKEEAPKPEVAGDEVTLSKKEYDDLLGRLKELETMKEQLLRSAADFENAKKRLLRERDEHFKFAQENLIRSLLPVLDNFSRALAHAEDGSNLKEVVTGIERVYKQLQDILQAQGLKPVDAVGKKFDPHFHEAVGYVQEAGEEDQVVDQIESGYELQGKLLRAAKVRVRMNPCSASPADDEKQEDLT